ncbi:ferric reductase like transmembrane component-domain-containing protein [Dactylonectria macrodidyma]|uniref:Ferric reductase like transmembrane component-domain-containing protein n=1 Tax=Dactylonectria macrodidyma TaxID=307937 RepID=A0A9P9JIA4_9HYPO|nr:ferric reductase like transmembrane component-domain-containing protein [Dactylonectria macrodidyma]
MRFSLSLGASLLLATAPISAAVASQDTWEPEVCFNSCQETLRAVHFDDMQRNQSRVNQTCHSRRHLVSLYLCVQVYCSPAARNVGLEPLNQTCLEYAGTAIPSFELVSNYTLTDIDKMRRIERNETGASVTFGEVVLPSASFFGVWWDTLDSVAYVYKYHHLYGAFMIAFWAVIVAIGVANHAISAVSNSKLTSHLPLKPPRRVSDYYSWLVSIITVPATFGTRCAQKIGWGTAPPRIQSITLVVFLAVNVVLSVIGYRIVPVSLYFETVELQAYRYVSDRTGIISFANFPLIWLFGMRNNVLMWLTGWDFGTYNNFHRWVARIATLQAIVHSVGYTILVIKEGGFSRFWGWWAYMFWWTGEVATVAMSILLGLSFYWIRRQQYEFFLIAHIGLSIIVLVAMLGHVSIFGGTYDILFWAPAFIWVADRVFRALRIMAFNPNFWRTWATATYNASSNIVRVSIPWGTSLYKPAPGTYYYIHVLNGPRLWESHPFTVASVLDDGQTAAKLLGEQVPLLESDDSRPCTDTVDERSIEGNSSSMTFLIRPYDGFTSRLRDVAAAGWPSKAPLRVLVDGPYGHTQPFHLFDNVVFLVGGSGIVVALSYLQVLTGAVSPKSVRIHWAVREPEFALDVLQRDIGDALGSSNLSIDIHITSYPREGSSDWPSQVNIRSGRIDAPSIIASASEKAHSESLAVVACGPAQMADAARKTVVDMLSSGITRVEYFEESFQR